MHVSMDRESLRERVEAGEVFEYLLFWGHRVPADGRLTPSCLSQWYPARSVVSGITYETAEHFMMAGKARLFGDDDMLQRILVAPDPNAAKKLGRKVRGFDEERWREARLSLVTEGSEAKFGQSARLKAFLLGTADRVLVEASPFDRIWGIGMSAKNPDAADPRT